jgi:hypothetical protein
MTRRTAIYVRVSTDKQTIENQLPELHQIAKHRGWEVVKEYRDAGISGSKGREARPVPCPRFLLTRPSMPAAVTACRSWPLR